jgi:hypothetical protein
MRISPLVILTTLTLAACGEVPELTGTDSDTETDTETSSGTDTSTTDPAPTTGGGTICTPNSSIACVCPDNTPGTQTCDSLGNGYGPCECEGGGSNSNSDGTTGSSTTMDATATEPDTVSGGETTTEGTTADTTEGTSSSTGDETTTGAPVCEDPGPEPNDSEDNAIDVGEQACNQAAETFEGVLDGDGDVDWFSYHGTFSALCIIGPNSAHTVTASDDVRLCVFVDCDQGNANLNCKNGAQEADSPEGLPGCCSGADVDFDVDCGLLSGKNSRVYLRVDEAPADACVEYSVQYKYDE